MTRLSASQVSAERQSQLLCIGVSHHTASVEFRERLSAFESQFPSYLQESCPALQEWALVTTCNRWELYAATNGSLEEATAQARAAVCAALGVPLQEPAALFIWHGRAAARHLCQVAAGLDSQILGESQIQGQVGSAYATGLEQGSVGPVLSALMRTAIRSGRRARAQTPISAQAVTMSSVALSMVEARAGALAGYRIALVGAGEMVRLALKSLHSRQVRQVTIVNRTVAHAEAMLLDSSWRAVGLDSLASAVAQSDIVFCATRSPGYVITPDLLASPSGSPAAKIVIDLAVPRDVDPDARRLPGVTLIDVDDLQGRLDQGLAIRRNAIPAVEALIEAELDDWEQEMRGLSLRPLVVELRQKAEQIRRQEMERTLRFLGDVDDSTRAHLDHLTRALVNKLLHDPTMHIKALAQEDEVDKHASTIRAFFGLAGDSSASHDSESSV